MNWKYFPAFLALSLFVCRSAVIVGTELARGWPPSIPLGLVAFWAVGIAAAVSVLYLPWRARIGKPYLWVPMMTFAVSIVVMLAMLHGLPRVAAVQLLSATLTMGLVWALASLPACWLSSRLATLLSEERLLALKRDGRRTP